MKPPKKIPARPSASSGTKAKIKTGQTKVVAGSDESEIVEVIPSPNGKIEIFKNCKTGQHYFRVKARNGQIIGGAEEGYHNYADVSKNILANAKIFSHILNKYFGL